MRPEVSFWRQVTPLALGATSADQRKRALSVIDLEAPALARGGPRKPDDAVAGLRVHAQGSASDSFLPSTATGLTQPCPSAPIKPQPGWFSTGELSARVTMSSGRLQSGD